MRATNRSFVFFRITGLSNEGEPNGAQGVPLTPLRSIAVDKIHVYGTPFFIEANLPIEGSRPSTPFRRLMVAQDTGSAIVGPARGDLYWGAGADAGRVAGRIRHPGRFVMLLPRELDMVAAGRHMPLPEPKPKIPEDEVAKGNGKNDQVKTGDGKAKPDAAKGADQPQGAEEIAPASWACSFATGIMTAGDGKPRRRKLSAEERVLWGRITRSVAPLRRGPVSAEPAEATPPPTKPHARTSADRHALPEAATPPRKPAPPPARAARSPGPTAACARR